MEMRIEFPSGARVEAHHGSFVIATDQPPRAGGAGAAPAPFDLFLASIGTCAGIYALNFLRQRGLSADGLAITLVSERDSETRMVRRIELRLSLPGGFPERYAAAILRAVDLCPVKRHLADPPAIRTTLQRAGATAVHAG